MGPRDREDLYRQHYPAGPAQYEQQWGAAPAGGPHGTYTGPKHQQQDSYSSQNGFVPRDQVDSRIPRDQMDSRGDHPPRHSDYYGTDPHSYLGNTMDSYGNPGDPYGNQYQREAPPSNHSEDSFFNPNQTRPYEEQHGMNHGNQPLAKHDGSFESSPFFSPKHKNKQGKSLLLELSNTSMVF